MIAFCAQNVHIKMNIRKFIQMVMLAMLSGKIIGKNFPLLFIFKIFSNVLVLLLQTTLIKEAMR